MMFFGTVKGCDWKNETGNDVFFEMTVDKTKFTFMLNEETDKKTEKTDKKTDKKSIEKTEKTAEKTIEKTIEKISKTAEKILSLMAENEFITTTQLSENIGVSVAAINQQIAKLKKQNLIRREGADKGGKWVVINKKKK